MKIKNSQSGMTLIELIVVITIISFVSAVLMFSYSGFSGNANIRNLAQEIALGIRKSQIYATSVAKTSSTIGAYGISFSARNSSQGADPTAKRFVLFADIPPTNKHYDSPGTNCGGGSECLETLTINSSDNIIKAEACTNSGCTSAVGDDSVDIIFQRPSPDANICLHKDGADCTGGPYSYAKITVRSAKGLEKVISVWNTGQISIQ